MSAGAQTSQGQINQIAGAIVTGLRDIFARVDNLNAELNIIGLADLENVYSFLPADAATLLSTLGNLEQLSLIYQGETVSQSLPFNFRSNSQALWGTEA